MIMYIAKIGNQGLNPDITLLLRLIAHNKHSVRATLHLDKATRNSEQESKGNE